VNPDPREVSCCEYACYEDPGCTCDGCREAGLGWFSTARALDFTPRRHLIVDVATIVLAFGLGYLLARRAGVVGS
jgi:hypothetical protein